MLYGNDCRKCRGYGLVSEAVKKNRKKNKKDGTNILVKCNVCGGSGKATIPSKTTRQNKLGARGLI